MQATTHAAISSDTALTSDAKEWEKMLDACRREINNLAWPKEEATISNHEKVEICNLGLTEARQRCNFTR